MARGVGQGRMDTPEKASRVHRRTPIRQQPRPVRDPSPSARSIAKAGYCLNLEHTVSIGTGRLVNPRFARRPRINSSIRKVRSELVSSVCMLAVMMAPQFADRNSLGVSPRLKKSPGRMHRPIIWKDYRGSGSRIPEKSTVTSSRDQHWECPLWVKS